MLEEQLADKAHASWSHWMEYLFSVCEVHDDGDGYEHHVIPREFVARWKRQIATPYAALSEKEQQSDREEVKHILPLIQEHMHALEQMVRAQHAYLLKVIPYTYSEGKEAASLRKRWQELGLDKEQACVTS